MSNIIKGYSVTYDNDEFKTIDTNSRSRQDAVKLRNNLRIIESTNNSVEKIDEEKIKELNEQNIILAKREAEYILAEAKKEAEKIKVEAVQEAKKKGYYDGFNQGNAQLSSQKAQFEAEKINLHKEYESMVKNLEPSMVEVISSLLYKITGILVEDKEDIMYYLIDKAMKKVDISSEYKIRVSKEDFEYMKSRKDDITNALKKEAHIDIEEDASLIKNQCLIETETQVIDCSLDTQLNNLITDLRLLSE